MITFRGPRPTPAMSPYFLGYLSAQKEGTHVTQSVVRRLPPMPFSLETLSGQAWLTGVMDNVEDRAKPARDSRYGAPQIH